MRAGLTVLVITITMLATSGARADDEAAWQALRDGGVIALMRHALAPGTGDPSGFVLDDCSTQRNLDETGRAQAKRIGDAFRARNVRVEGVWSSQWCRCLETARLLDQGPVRPLPSLNSFFRTPERRDPQLKALGEWLSKQQPEASLVLVTHQVVVSGVTGQWTRSGDIIVARPRPDGTVEVIGRISPP